QRKGNVMGNSVRPLGSAVETLPISPTDGVSTTESERVALKHLAAPTRRRRLLLALVVGLAFGAGWLLAGGNAGRGAKEDLRADAAAQRNSAVVVVTAEPVMYRPVQRAVESVGTLYAFEEIAICARVEGRVRKLGFDVSDRVSPEQVLVEIDPTDYELS